MGKILRFKSCAVGGEFYGIGRIPTSYGYISIESPSNIVNYINSQYASDPNLSGKVTGIGRGWQQFVMPTSGIVKFTVRGAAGGSTGTGTINPVTGACSGAVNRPGRGAKIVGRAKLKKNDILYILVGCRGWCNDGSDWGSGGGGASVVLKDNPSGAYTFAPLNRRVDVLFVAGGGGGCYDSSWGSAYYGGDAVVTNGTNTNGGGANGGGAGGAGLTGNSSRGHGSNPGATYSILSGNVLTTSLNAVHYGGWGGGGVSYDGGGAGGGYSGGTCGNNGQGGQGGTSYINPTLCEEIFRGYATVAEDSGRNLVNPWTAYGFVEMETGRDDTKYILAQDSEGYKYFDGPDKLDGTTKASFTNEWKLLPSQAVPEEATYVNFGDTIIYNKNGLKDNARLLVMSKEPNEFISISGNANGVVIKTKHDVSISDVSLIKSITAVTNLTNLDVRFAVSKNSGATWQTYNAGVWTNIDITNKAQFQGTGYALSQFSAIPLADWNSYGAKILQFAFCITQNGANGNTVIDKISIVADLVGSWRHFKDTEAQYEYISDSEMKITFLQAGNYKVNYLDKIVS